MAGHRGPPVSVSASAGFSFHRGDSCKCACPRAGAPSSWSLTGFTQLQGTRPALDHTEPRSWLGWRDASPGSPAPVGAFLDGCRRLLTLGWFPEGVSTPLARDSGLSAAPELSLVPGTRSLSRGHGGRQPRLLSVPWCPAQPLESLTAEPPFSLMLQVPLPQRRAPAAVGVCAVVLAARGPATAGGSHTVTTREQSGQRTARWTSRCSPRRCRSTTSPLAPARAASPSASLGAWPPLPARDWERPGQQPPRCEADGAHAGVPVRVSLRALVCCPWASSRSCRLHTQTASPPLNLLPLACDRARLLEMGRGAPETVRVSGGDGSFPSRCCLPEPATEPATEHRAPHPTRQVPLLTGSVPSGPGCGVCSILSCCPVPSTLCSITLHGATLCLVSSPLFLAPP